MITTQRATTSLDITELRENLLIGLRRWWPSAAGADALPSGWLDAAITRSAAAQLRTLLAADQQRQPSPWAIKDPRSSLLLPLWKQVAEDLHIPLRIVLSVRDPAEVMVSLLQRDSITAGMTAQRSQHLWWHHNRNVLLGAGQLPLLVVSYSAWFKPRQCKRQLERLSEFCLGHPATSTQLHAATAQIQPSHRRSRRSRRNLPAPIHPWVARLHSRLQRLALAGSAAPTCPTAALVGATQRASPPAAMPGPWFQSEHYRNQQPPLPTWVPGWWHYRLVGWRKAARPIPSLRPTITGIKPTSRALPQQDHPCATFFAVSSARAYRPQPWRIQPGARARLLAMHCCCKHGWRGCILRGAALAVMPRPARTRTAHLTHWLHAGISASDLDVISNAAAGQFSGEALSAPASRPLPTQARFTVTGAAGDGCNWQVHAWLQHLPLPQGFALQTSAADTIHLLLGPVPQGPASLRLIGLASEPWVFCTDPQAMALLKRLGIHAQLLDPRSTGNGWLDQPNTTAEACQQLGLPPALALAKQAKVLCLGSAGPNWTTSSTAQCGVGRALTR